MTMTKSNKTKLEKMKINTTKFKKIKLKIFNKHKLIMNWIISFKKIQILIQLFIRIKTMKKII